MPGPAHCAEDPFRSQAFKEAREAVADAALKRAPGGTTAADEKEVARVLRCVPLALSPPLRNLLSIPGASSPHTC